MKKIKTWLDRSIVELLADCAAGDWPSRFRPAVGRRRDVRMTATREKTAVTQQRRLYPTATNNGKRSGQGCWQGFAQGAAWLPLR